jgi:7,8-dihydropterin-6-yl-methyl-4-(beta-D-ribofuranosyl)aminobenzene 5'-phosphate synthase
MKVKIISIYENTAQPELNLKGSAGNGFYIEFEEEKILFDTGFKGKILMHNLNQLKISPDSISKIIFSHGHFDHTWGLVKLLENRNNPEKIKIYGHFDLTEKKRVKVLGIKAANIGFPKLNKEQKGKIEYHLTDKPVEINKYLSTTGIIAERPEKDGTIDKIVHKFEGKWIKDPIMDDLSLILKTKKGLVIIGGCMHSGLLNTCAHVSKMFPQESIYACMGGTHMMNFNPTEIENIIDKLKNQYNISKLWLNHCTGKKPIAQISAAFGSEIASPFPVGSELIFEC